MMISAGSAVGYTNRLLSMVAAGIMVKVGNQGGQGIVVGEVENLSASWEEALKLNVGFELSLFEKVKLQADYFREKRSGIFLQRSGLPIIVGISTIPYINVGETLNQGIDANLEYSQKISNVFVTARGNFTYNRNKMINNDDPDWEYKYQNRIGKPFVSMVPYNLWSEGIRTVCKPGGNR